MDVTSAPRALKNPSRALAWVMALCLVLASCGGSPHAVVGAGAPSRPLQIANGPIQAAIATRPLTLKLTAGADPITLRFKHEPRAGLLFDLDTGQVLWRRLPTRILPIASLTKMMTALVVVSHTRPSDRAPLNPSSAFAYRSRASTRASRLAWRRPVHRSGSDPASRVTSGWSGIPRPPPSPSDQT